MPKICYEQKVFSPEKQKIIDTANRVIRKYQEQGYNLTLRQLYYVFVSNDLFPDAWTYAHVGGNKFKRDPNGTKNAPPNYNALGSIISDGRMAGLIDWNAIVDRARSSNATLHFDKPSQAVKTVLDQYAIDKWADQPHYVEVWVEKEALEDVLMRACVPLDVRYFACKGYTSQSAMWEAAQRLVKQQEAGKEVHIIHLGDHDPSGIDMSRDIFTRLGVFTRTKVHVRRIALNMSQIQQYRPPPNPAKSTDPRFTDYQKKFGDESWELDALEPAILNDLITAAVRVFRDEKLWHQAIETELKGRNTLETLIDNFPEVVKFLRDKRSKV